MEPIRVLHEVTVMNAGGIETLLMNIYRNIDRSKVQFDFMLHREAGTGFYDKEIESLGGKLYSGIPFNPLHHHQYLISLDTFFEQHPEYSILHAHNAFSMYTLRSAMKNQVPVRIAHSHNTMSVWDYKKIFKLYAKLPLKKYATDLFACSVPAGEYFFGKKAVQSGDVKIIKNGIAPNNFIFNRVLREKHRKLLGVEDKFVIGHVGRFFLQKNHDFLIDIFYEVLQNNRNAVLVLVGEGGLQSKIKEKVKSLGIEGQVLFLGVRADVNELLNAMDVFVFPSFFEGLGIVCIEAQASGLPCVVADTIPKEAFVTKNITSLSLKDTPQKWADVILQYQHTIRENTYEQILQHGYDIKAVAKDLQTFYCEEYQKIQGSERT